MALDVFKVFAKGEGTKTDRPDIQANISKIEQASPAAQVRKLERESLTGQIAEALANDPHEARRVALVAHDAKVALGSGSSARAEALTAHDAASKAVTVPTVADALKYHAANSTQNLIREALGLQERVKALLAWEGFKSSIGIGIGYVPVPLEDVTEDQVKEDLAQLRTKLTAAEITIEQLKTAHGEELSELQDSNERLQKELEEEKLKLHNLLTALGRKEQGGAIPLPDIEDRRDFVSRQAFEAFVVSEFPYLSEKILDDMTHSRGIVEWASVARLVNNTSLSSTTWLKTGHNKWSKSQGRKWVEKNFPPEKKALLRSVPVL